MPGDGERDRYETMLAMKDRSRVAVGLRILTACACTGLACEAVSAQADSAAVIRGIDAEVQARVENVLGFTDIEHYAVYRGEDHTHPAAEMTVKDAFLKGKGKIYAILSQSGSGLVLKFGLHPLIENETDINEPGKVGESWFTSANYDMKVRPGGIERLNGRECYLLDITAKHDAPNMIDGTLWVDAKDFSIVQVQGVASKKPSIWAGTTHMMRDYVNIDGYPMATHARAESDSFLFGHTVVVITYSDYHLQIKKGK
jgi:hypothetical protein